MVVSGAIKGLSSLKTDKTSISTAITKISNDGVIECITRSCVLDDTEFESVFDVVQKKGTTIGFEVELSSKTEFEPELKVILNDNGDKKIVNMKLSDAEKDSLYSLVDTAYKEQQGSSMQDFINKAYEYESDDLDIDGIYMYLQKGTKVVLGENGETQAILEDGALHVSSSRMKMPLAIFDDFDLLHPADAIGMLESIFYGNQICEGVAKFENKSIAEAIKAINKDVISNALSQVYDEEFANKIIKDFGGIYRD